ncbi:AIR synthase-related protein, partial [Nitrospira sp. BLG_2]|uniref:AIR synthase-related protein n=1 Tax=Nitrospira sp. BLG_2 TaxID=3397507 RepID=UPI003B9AC28C
GALPIGLTDCLNFGNPERPDIMWQFAMAIEGMKDACEHFQIPIVSGNVSFYNETNGLSIYPTPMLGMVGLIEEAERTMTQWFKQEGDDIILLGSSREDLGGSEYLKIVHAREQGSPPYLSLNAEKALHDCVLLLIRGGLLQSAHDCSEGGVAVALAESCISGPEQTWGAVVRLTRGRLRKDAVLFGESQSRVVVSAKPAHRQAVLDHVRSVGVPAEVIGAVSGERLIVSVGDEGSAEPMIDQRVTMLRDRWGLSLEQALNQV